MKEVTARASKGERGGELSGSDGEASGGGEASGNGGCSGRSG